MNSYSHLSGGRCKTRGKTSMSTYENTMSFKKVEEFYDFIILTCYNYVKELAESEYVIIESKKVSLDLSSNTELKTQLFNTLIGIIGKHKRVKYNKKYKAL